MTGHQVRCCCQCVRHERPEQGAGCGVGAAQSAVRGDRRHERQWQVQRFDQVLPIVPGAAGRSVMSQLSHRFLQIS